MVRPISGNKVEVNGKSLRFKVMGSKSPKKIKSPRKMNIFVPTSVLRVISKRNTNNVESQDVDYDSEDLESFNLDDSDSEKQPKSNYKKFKAELLNKDFQFKLCIKLIFWSKFKDAIREWFVLNGREITLIKNESYRVRVKWVTNTPTN